MEVKPGANTPSVSVNAEPGARDQYSLRSIQHKDRSGNIISMFNLHSYKNTR